MNESRSRFSKKISGRTQGNGMFKWFMLFVYIVLCSYVFTGWFRWRKWMEIPHWKIVSIGIAFLLLQRGPRGTDFHMRQGRDSPCGRLPTRVPQSVPATNQGDATAMVRQRICRPSNADPTSRMGFGTPIRSYAAVRRRLRLAQACRNT